jgi:hypothetical protein
MNGVAGYVHAKRDRKAMSSSSLHGSSAAGYDMASDMASSNQPIKPYQDGEYAQPKGQLMAPEFPKWQVRYSVP